MQYKDRMIAFAPAFNTRGKHDATGAFQPEARAFLQHNKAEGGLFLINNRDMQDTMRRQVIGVLTPDFERHIVPTIAFFCHGLGSRIQFGFNVRNVDVLAAAIAAACDRSSKAVRVVLYACNTGIAPPRERYEPLGGDGSFADALRDALCRADVVHCQVDAHTTAGHTTKNPYVRRFVGLGSRSGGFDGFFLVSPTSKLLWQRWCRALRTTSLRFEFPFLSVHQIHERLFG